MIREHDQGSDRSFEITGTTIPVDGGWTVR
jgi:hypothetical protein